MRYGRGTRKHVGRFAVALLAMTAFWVAAAPGAQAAAPAGSLTPYVSCYFDNQDGTVTFSVGVTSKNSGTVTVPVGTDNRVTLGAANRGQPTSFSPGTHDNVWAATVTWNEVFNNINWSLTGNDVQLANFNRCSSRPVPAEGNALAALAFAAVVTVAGSALMGDRRRRRRGSAGDVA